LEAILLEDPPPTLKEATKRFGHEGNFNLAQYCPELCRSISARYAEYRRARFRGISHKLKEALHDEPPPDLRAVASRSGYTRNYLRGKFPEESQAIDRRHLQFRKRRSLEKKRQARARIRLLAVDLHAMGQYPSQSRLQMISNGPIGLNSTEFCAFLREVRRELGLIKIS
jgi:hypothetical protein